ncbi:MAG: hypothetical protein RIC84_01600 [Aggregatilineales bacterium]
MSDIHLATFHSDEGAEATLDHFDVAMFVGGMGMFGGMRFSADGGGGRGRGGGGPRNVPDQDWVNVHGGQNNYRGRYISQLSRDGKDRLPRDWDVHHVIPQKFRKHPEFENFDFHHPTNLRGVEGARSNDNIHSQITTEWRNWEASNPNPSRVEIENFANQIEQKYSQYYWENQ